MVGITMVSLINQHYQRVTYSINMVYGHPAIIFMAFPKCNWLVIFPYFPLSHPMMVMMVIPKR